MGGYETRKKELNLVYGILDKPSWPSSLLFGLQHFLSAFSGILGTPLIVLSYLCIDDNEYGYVIQSKVISSMFFAAALATFLQTMFGSRLPIMQGASFTFVTPAIALLTSKKYECTVRTSNADTEHIWRERMTTLQGGLLIAALIEIAIGAMGLIGVLLKYIGPITIGPVLITIGVSLADPAINYCQGNWAVAFIVMFVLITCSMILHNIAVPSPSFKFSLKKCIQCQGTKRTLCFRLYPILIGVIVGIIFCLIFTAADVFPPGDASRTDSERTKGIQNAPWIFFPYPGQWGAIQFRAAAIVGMVTGVLASIIESIGDYFAAARIVAAPPIPRDAINRGIMFEGLGCLWASLIGSGVGVTSYSGNIGALGVTKNGSPRIMIMASVMLLVFGISPKIGACLLWIPRPVIGGVFAVMCSLPTAVGISTLQYANLNSTRNQFVIGFALFMSFILPGFMERKPDAIQTNSDAFNELSSVLLSTNMFVGGLFAVLLDNLLPGTPEERGLTSWRTQAEGDDESVVNQVYGAPFVRFNRVLKRLPFMPNFRNGVTQANGKVEPTLEEADL